MRWDFHGSSYVKWLLFVSWTFRDLDNEIMDFIFIVYFASSGIFQCQFSFQSVCCAFQNCSACTICSGQSGTWVEVLKIFGILITFRFISGGPKNSKQFYGAIFMNFSIYIISPVLSVSLNSLFWSFGQKKTTHFFSYDTFKANWQENRKEERFLIPPYWHHISTQWNSCSTTVLAPGSYYTSPFWHHHLYTDNPLWDNLDTGV